MEQFGYALLGAIAALVLEHFYTLWREARTVHRLAKIVQEDLRSVDFGSNPGSRPPGGFNPDTFDAIFPTVARLFPHDALELVFRYYAKMKHVDLYLRNKGEVDQYIARKIQEAEQQRGKLLRCVSDLQKVPREELMFRVDRFD